MSMIEIKHLTKYYHREEPVISDLNLQFPETGLNIVVGKSGCGKTTLLNVIGTMDNDYIGSVKVDDKVLSKMSPVEKSQYKNFTIGYIFQKDDLFEDLTVEENLNIVLNMQSKKESIPEMLEKVGLKGFEKRKIKYLSGGERQRVSIARVLIKDCQIILADEPTSALDSKNGNLIFKILHEVSKERLVIAVTHDTKKAFQYADRIIKLSSGRITEDEVINETNGNCVRQPFRKPKFQALLPIFRVQFLRGLFINLFATLLLALIVVVMCVAKEQSFVYNEYVDYQKNGTTTINTDRVMLTQIANNIDYFEVVKVDSENDAYYYLKNYLTKRGGLSNYDKIMIEKLTSGININTYDYDIGNLIIDYISISNLKSIIPETGGQTYYWHEDVRTNISYYLYDENNNYDIVGSLPKLANEILVTDTVADLYCHKRSDDGTLTNGSVSEYYGKYTGDYSILIGDTLTVKDIYKQVDDFYYTNDIEYVVTGIINTGLLDYYYYNLGDYYFTSKVKQQTGNVSYMNSAYNQPFGYIVTMNNIDGIHSIPYLYDDLTLSEIDANGANLINSISSFRGTDNYRFIKYNYYSKFYDDLNSDVSGRILCKSTIENNLQGNEIMLSLASAKKIYPELDASSNASIISYFNNNIADTTLAVNFTTASGVVTIDCPVVGITMSETDISMYVSDDIYTKLFKADQSITNYGITLYLKGLDLKERKALMAELYQYGYILNPVNVMPGAYSEFIDEQSIATITDSIGEEEKGNISLYNMFSDYYNTDAVEGMNSFLNILSHIAAFTLIMGLIVAVGCIYLNERKNKIHIVKLSILGVRPRKIVAMQVANYLVMMLFVALFAYLGTMLFCSIINKTMTLTFDVINAKGMAIGSFNVIRTRIIMTNVSVRYAIYGAIATFIIGFISCAITVKQFHK